MTTLRLSSSSPLERLLPVEGNVLPSPLSLASVALTSVQPDLRVVLSGVVDLKNGTTIAPALPSGARWTCEAVALIPVHLTSKQTWLSLTLTLAVPLAVESPGGTSTSPVSRVRSMVQLVAPFLARLELSAGGWVVASDPDPP